VSGALRAPAAAKGPAIPGYTPAQLRSAYGLTSAAGKDGSGAVIAVVTAYSYPDAAADLAAYRAHFKLGACRSGSCLRTVNEYGRTSHLPAANSTWALADAAALDAISALCPKCDLLLVEAASNGAANLGTAENTAVAKGAKYVLNTWFEPEFVGEDSYAQDFDHPGVVIVADAGDNGYGRTFPGDLPYVTSVGGTTLTPTKYNTRHWAEIAWSDTAAGCSALQVKPSWQRADANASTGCPNRTQNDVSADADPATGAAVYDSYKAKASWTKTGGTVLAAAIVTATYALAGPPAPDTYPASYPYEHSSGLTDVIYGSLSSLCQLVPVYLCNAQKGFDGPTGLGTPYGTAAFAAAGTDPVTVLDPGTADYLAGTSADIKISGMDSRTGATLTYTARGLPSGLAIAAVPHTLDAEITGTLPAAIRSYAVTVTATDPKTKRSNSTKFSVVATGSLTPSGSLEHQIATDYSPPDNAPSECLDGGAETPGTTVVVDLCEEQLTQNDWEFVANPGPGTGGTLQIGGLCLALAGSTVALAVCEPGSTQQAWAASYGGELANLSTGTCLDAGDYSGPLALKPCSSSKASQQWQVESTLESAAVPGTCIGTYDSYTQPPTDIVTEPCGQSGYDYTFFYTQSNIITPWACVTWGSQGYIQTETNSYGGCTGGADDLWDPLPNGEILDIGTGLCLGDPGNSGLPGNQLQLAPCDGALGEIWAMG